MHARVCVTTLYSCAPVPPALFLLLLLLQGSHTAMKSGMLAAEATFAALKDDTVKSGDISQYQQVCAHTNS